MYDPLKGAHVSIRSQLTVSPPLLKLERALGRFQVLWLFNKIVKQCKSLEILSLSSNSRAVNHPEKCKLFRLWQKSKTFLKSSSGHKDKI